MRLLATLVLLLTPLLADDLGDDLLAATRKGDIAQVKVLLDKGAAVNAKTRYNQTPLFFACDRGYLEIAKLLIERGADVDAKDNFYNATPLTWAMSKKNKEMIALLITKVVDPSDALRESIQFNNKELFQLILDKGKATPVMLSDALQMTELAKKTEMSEALKAKGAKLNTYSIDAATLNDYAGSYSDGAQEFNFVVKDGKLTFQMGASLVPTAKDTFRLISQGMDIHFIRESDKVTSFKLPGRGGDTIFKRKESSK